MAAAAKPITAITGTPNMKGGVLETTIKAEPTIVAPMRCLSAFDS
jgi:hypothetical protein